MSPTATSASGMIARGSPVLMLRSWVHDGDADVGDGHRAGAEDEVAGELAAGDLLLGQRLVREVALPWRCDGDLGRCRAGRSSVHLRSARGRTGRRARCVVLRRARRGGRRAVVDRPCTPWCAPVGGRTGSRGTATRCGWRGTPRWCRTRALRSGTPMRTSGRSPRRCGRCTCRTSSSGRSRRRTSGRRTGRRARSWSSRCSAA